MYVKEIQIYKFEQNTSNLVKMPQHFLDLWFENSFFARQVSCLKWHKVVHFTHSLWSSILFFPFLL